MSDKILEIKWLHKTFKFNFNETHVLKGVDLEVKAWEIYGFLWPNGAWKTTTMKCVLDFIKPTKWEIRIFGKSLKENPEILKNIWFTPEQAYYYEYLTWEEFILFMGRLTWMKDEDIRERWAAFLEKLKLTEAKDRYIKSYSKWMKQRLGLIAGIINDPDLVFLDEPMSGLDPLWRVLVKELMVDLKKQWKTIFFNTHILSDVQEIADHFGIIFHGKIIYEDSTKNIKWSLEELFTKIINEQEEIHETEIR